MCFLIARHLSSKYTLWVDTCEKDFEKELEAKESAQFGFASKGFSALDGMQYNPRAAQHLLGFGSSSQDENGLLSID